MFVISSVFRERTKAPHRRLWGREWGIALGRQLWACLSTLGMDGARESWSCGGPLPSILWLQEKGCPAPDGDLIFVLLHSGSRGPSQDPKGCLCSSHFPYLPPAVLRHFWIEKKVVWACAYLTCLVLGGSPSSCGAAVLTLPPVKAPMGHGVTLCLVLSATQGRAKVGFRLSVLKIIQ